jgi:hypothetical protein
VGNIVAMKRQSKRGIGELTMDEKIEEMAKLIKPIVVSSYLVDRGNDEVKQKAIEEVKKQQTRNATAIYNAGYRKENDTAREIYKELFEKQTEVYNKYVFKKDNDYDDLETNAIINFSDSLSYEFEKYFKEKYGVDLGE